MRQAKTFKDLPLGTPVEIRGCTIYKGLVCEHQTLHNQYPFIRILFADGDTCVYYEEEIPEERIFIVEVK